MSSAYSAVVRSFSEQERIGDGVDLRIEGKSLPASLYKGRGLLMNVDGTQSSVVHGRPITAPDEDEQFNQPTTQGVCGRGWQGGWSS